MERKKLLVTGGARFIGGNFVQYMVDKYPDYDIYNLDQLTYAGDLTKHKQIEDKVNYHFIKADIANREEIFNHFEKEKFNYVIHFAAESHVDRSFTDPEYSYIPMYWEHRCFLMRQKNSSQLNLFMSQ